MSTPSPCLRTVFRALPLVFGLPLIAADIPGAPAPGTRPALPPGVSATDWTSIRSEYESHRHGAVATPEGLVMVNPGQRWRTHFDASGFEVRPDHGDWTWGLAFKSYGFAGGAAVPVRPSSVTANGLRVAYDRDDMLREWFVNDQRGLEHGFTVATKPMRNSRASTTRESGGTVSGQATYDPLTFTLEIRGNLCPQVQQDGRGVHFVDDDGALVLTYTGLEAWDADGKPLPAHFERMGSGGGTLCLSVDERGARYPVTVDPIVQQAYLKASHSGAGDQFGYAVALSGDTVAVSALGDDVGGTSSGAVYIFVRTGTTWAQQGPALKASNSGASDLFGWSLSLSGDTLVAGAPYEDSSTKGVNGNQSDNGSLDSGAAYIFVRNGINWSQQAYVKASNVTTYFGHAVAVSANTLVVGAHYESSGATGVNGNQNDQSAIFSGAAYVFLRSGTSWSQEAYLKASNTAVGSLFGYAAAISGDTLVIGAFGEFSNATGVNGNQADHSAENSGAAYVFVRSGTTWSQQAYLKASNTAFDDKFGFSVSASGDTIVVGAPGEDSGASGVNGNQGDNSAPQSGAAYIFIRSGTIWSQQAYLKASNAGAQDGFGSAVAVSADTAAVGAPQEGSEATGVNGNSINNNAVLSGAAYVFLRSGTVWTQQAYLKSSNSGTGDVFGRAVAASGNTVAAGAPGEASNAMGVNGNQNDNSTSFGGAAYVLARTTATWSQQAYLKSSNTTAINDQFGWSVAAAGDIAVIGAPQESSNATGVDGNQGDVSMLNAGAAYVFFRSGGVWRQQAYLKASNSQEQDHFGTSVAAGADFVVIGAPQEDGRTPGVNHPTGQSDNSAPNSGAAYVFVRNGNVWSQQAYLKASNPGNLDLFGSSVSASGETVVIGATDEDSTATGVNGTQAIESASGSGAAYVFFRSGGVWSQQAYLKASNTNADDRFGTSVGISGDTVVVGAEREDSDSTGVNGNGLNTGALQSGAAYVFIRSGGVWSHQAYLKASNTGPADAFGWSVAVAGDTVVVGAPKEDSNATGVNHPTAQNNNSAPGSGAAYVFARTGTGWTQQGYLKASNTGDSDAFGASVATSGDTVAVGASSEASNATGVDGTQSNNSAGGSGAAYVFGRSGAAWFQHSYLKASNTGAGDAFGAALAMSGGTLLVGAFSEDSNARGVNGNQADNSGFESGAAFVFNLQAQSALTAWRVLWFSSPDNSGNGADMADPDADGLVNLLEFATGQNPLQQLPLPPALTTAGGLLEFVYPRSKAAHAEMQFIVEWSDSLAVQSWSIAGTSEVIESNIGPLEQVKVSILPGSSPARFIRLRVVAF